MGWSGGQGRSLSVSSGRGGRVGPWKGEGEGQNQGGGADRARQGPKQGADGGC